MGGSRFLPKKAKTSLLIEKQLLIKHYDFLTVDVKRDVLACTGKCRPSSLSREYTYKVEYRVNAPPKVYVLHPEISYHQDIHMYPQDNSLCLYYPKDYDWNDLSKLYDTIVPWIHEWFVFYELYLLKGKWLHPFVKHN